MAYDATVAVPYALTSRMGSGMVIWAYASGDAVTVVDAVGYFTDGYERGMRVGDIVLVLDNDASPITGSWCWVTAASTTALSVDLSDGVTITGTDSD